jgi:hypothetical protein
MQEHVTPAEEEISAEPGPAISMDVTHKMKISSATSGPPSWVPVMQIILPSSSVPAGMIWSRASTLNVLEPFSG